MNPIAMVKYIVERLEGTPFEPWVNALLFLLFAAAVWAIVSALLGKAGRAFMLEAAARAITGLSKTRPFAPEAEHFRKRIEPYVDLFGSLYFAFVGLYSATLVGLSFALAMNNAPVWALLIALVWVMASFMYTRINLVAASWAYHEIKTRR